VIEDICFPSASLRPFPAREDIFAVNAQWLARHIHPLCSIELSTVIPGAQGWVHLLSPIEPHEGYIGDHTSGFHDEYCSENWISFRLDEDNRYTFLGQQRYFLLESDQQPSQAEWMRDELLKHYAIEEKSYIESQQRYAMHGGLYSPKRFKPLEKYDPTAAPFAILDQLGGAVGWGNWTGFPPPPAAFTIDTSDDDDIKLFTRDGERLQFIAAVPGWNYRESGADWILLFYAPQARIALLTFDWT
jgi:hypothetical protein